MKNYLISKGYTNVEFDSLYQNDSGDYVGEIYNTDQGRLFYNFDTENIFNDKGYFII